MPYPTKEQIMEGPEVKHKPEVIQLVKTWKETEWKESLQETDPQMKNVQKGIAIQHLLYRIADLYQKPVNVMPGERDCYNFLQRTIFLSGTSILTALHELGHHLFGPDETKACRWSIHLFRKTFPKAFRKLKWEGHMLVRERTRTFTAHHPEWGAFARVRVRPRG